jgi:hypothetical protein
MYRIRTAGISKQDLEKRWNLPDRVFFACGACHILAHAFLERHGSPATKVFWIRPDPGFTGNHIFVVTSDWAFDYHGYSRRQPFLDHTFRRAGQLWPGWRGTLREIPRDVLVSEVKSKTIDGLWLREPGQFFHDALPRACAYLNRFPAPQNATELCM